MNALIFTDADAQGLIAYQKGQHRLAPVRLTDGRWLLTEDLLTEITEGIFRGKLTAAYTLVSFEDVRGLLPVPELDDALLPQPPEGEL